MFLFVLLFVCWVQYFLHVFAFDRLTYALLESTLLCKVCTTFDSLKKFREE